MKQLQHQCEIHDHFDGSAHCVQCGGECRLHGAERVATELVRWIFDKAALRREELNTLELMTLRKAGVDIAAFTERARATACSM